MRGSMSRSGNEIPQIARRAAERGPLKGHLYVLERAASGLRHISGEYAGGEKGKPAEQEVCTEGGCIQEDRGYQSHEPVSKLEGTR